MSSQKNSKKIQSLFQQSRTLLDDFMQNDTNLAKVQLFAEKMHKTIKRGNKIISCGNGGSMCDAMHFAEELTGRFKKERNPLPAVSISDASHITCVANDYGFEYVFSRYIEGLGQKGDLLLAISTSGNSENIIQAVKVAQKKKMEIFCLLGKDGGKLKNLSNNSIIIPAKESARIQEMHIKIIHIAIEILENWY